MAQHYSQHRNILSRPLAIDHRALSLMAHGHLICSKGGLHRLGIWVYRGFLVSRPCCSPLDNTSEQYSIDAGMEEKGAICLPILPKPPLSIAFSGRAGPSRNGLYPLPSVIGPSFPGSVYKTTPIKPALSALATERRSEERRVGKEC